MNENWMTLYSILETMRAVKTGSPIPLKRTDIKKKNALSKSCLLNLPESLSPTTTARQALPSHDIPRL